MHYSYFDIFFLKDMTGPWAGPGVYFVDCQSIRISLKTSLSLFFFYHIKEESFHFLSFLPLPSLLSMSWYWASLTRSCLMKAQSWKYHLNYYRICIFAFFHWPLIVKYIKFFPSWNLKKSDFSFLLTILFGFGSAREGSLDPGDIWCVRQSRRPESAWDLDDDE